MIARLSKRVLSNKSFDPTPKEYQAVAQNMINVAHRYAVKHNLNCSEVVVNCVSMIMSHLITHLDESNSLGFIEYIENYIIKEGWENRGEIQDSPK